MSPTQRDKAKEPRTTVIECLTARRRRAVLALLGDHVSSVSVRELAVQLAATEQEIPEENVTEEATQTVHVALHHTHLPVLHDAGLIELDRIGEAVRIASHPALRDPQFQRIIETDAAEWDAVLANLANPQRRIIVSVLADRDGPLSRNELAREVVARDPEGEVRVDDGELLVSLHHVHLPKLVDAGLVEYDAAAGTITYEGHPALEAGWLEFAPDESSRTVLTAVQHSHET